MLDVPALNEEQWEVALSANPFIAVAAGAGSGKTTTLITRIATKVAAGVDPKRIWIISFSNAAAKVFTDRLSRLNIEPGYAGTIHGAMLRLLNRHGHLLGYRKGALTILNEDARATLLRETAERLGYGKHSMVAIERNQDAKAQAINREYGFTVKRSQMIDYDGILTEGVKLLRASGFHMEPLAEILLDEVQDSGEADWAIIDALPAESKVVCGDDLQSIYGFRGARPELFVRRANGPSGFFTMQFNYRSDRLICQAANELIKHNSDQLPKKIVSTSEQDGIVEALPINSSREEASSIAWHMRRWQKAGTEWNEIAVLARTNEIVNGLRQEFSDMGIPVAREQRQRFPDDWQLCLTTIQLILDPANNILCEQYLKGRKAPAAEVNALKMNSLKSGTPMSTLAQKCGTCFDIGALFEWINLPARLAMQGIGDESVALISERMKALPMRHPTLSDLMADLWDSDQWSSETKEHGVFVGTVHSAKGREFDAVVVTGMEEGVMPSLAKSSDLEEERRLAFVAMTRARHRLVLAYCERRTAYGRTTEQKHSRFIDEAGIAPF